MSLGSGQFSGQRAVKGHLVRGSGGVAGEIADLRDDIKRDFLANAAIAVEEFVDAAAADPNGIKTSIASAATAQSYSGAALNGVVGAGVMSPPRNITITTTLHADIDAVDVLVTGLDVNGDEVTDTITLTDGGGATDVGTVAFAQVTQVDIPAQSGTGGALEIGFGDVIGLGKPLVSRAGAPVVTLEIEDGTVLAADAVTGTFVDAATVGPNGTYEPATVPDGSVDYALHYEYDASQNK